jgi:hypothetical protein
MSKSNLYWEATKTLGMVTAIKIYDDMNVMFAVSLFDAYVRLKDNYLTEIVRIEKLNNRVYYAKEKKNKLN